MLVVTLISVLFVFGLVAIIAENLTKKRNMLGYVILRPNAKMSIMRGISGAGKSRLANKIKEDNNGVIYSADNEITKFGEGDYNKGYQVVFDDGRTAISKAHSNVLSQVMQAVKTENHIIIDNTNLTRSSVKPYIKMALEAGYDENNIEIVDIGLNGLTAEELAKRNSHSVNIDIINKMITSYNAAGKLDVKTIFEFNATDEQVLKDMKSNEKFIDILNRYHSEGWLIKQVHPTEDLIVWNYSVKTTYEGFWNTTTLMCRSLVTDSNGIIISRGFGKFFNFEEIVHSFPIDKFKDAKFYEKVDGSYIGIFWYIDKWIARSKGSFTTIQAEKALEHFKSFENVEQTFKKGLTHNFEVIYPNNRIVVDYGVKDTIVYLATTDNKGNSFVLDKLPNNVEKAKSFDITFDYDKIKAMDDGVNEGLVGVTKDGMRFKIKYATYVTNHGIITNTTSYDIWRGMKDGTIDELVALIPDECYGFVKKVRTEVQENYDIIINEIINNFNSIENVETLTPKEFADKALKLSFSSQLFRLYRGEDIETEYVWKQVKPEFQRPISGL